MIRHTLWIAVVAVVPMAGFARADDRPSAAPKIPEGLLLVEDDVFYELADEPERHFQEAHLKYIERDYTGAAADIRKGVAILKLATSLAPREQRKELQASILELETLATEMQAGKVRSRLTLDRMFGRAFLALADYNYLAAVGHVKAEQPEEAGYHLRSAARDLQRAAGWRGAGAADALEQTAVEAEKISAKLISGTGGLFENAAKLLEALHAEANAMRELMKTAE